MYFTKMVLLIGTILAHPTNFDCVILNWIDGDTVDVNVDLGFDLVLKRRVRVYGLNAPEIHSTDLEEKKAGLESKVYAEKLIPVGSVVKIIDHGQEKFGRWLGTIEFGDHQDFAKTMIETGHGKAYFGGPR